MPTPSFTPGQRVTLQRETQGSKYHHAEVDEVVCDVIRWLPEFNLLEAHENSRLTFFRGYRNAGRNIGARNPYGDDSQWRENCFQPGGRNGYIIAPDYSSPGGDWVVVAQPPEAEPAQPAGIRSYATPTGVPIAGTLENLTGTAILDLADGRVELSVDPKTGHFELQSDYEGTTDVDWDGQKTATEEGQMVFVDESGHRWPANQLIPIDTTSEPPTA